MPYRLPLVVLARFFDMHPGPSPRTRALLVRWVWRGALSGVHTDSNHARIHELQSQVDGDEAGSVERLLGTVSMPPRFPTSSASWNGRGAETRLCAIAMAHLRPRDPDTGEELGQEQIRMLLDKKRFNRVFVFGGGEGSSVAQRLLFASSKQLARLPDAPNEVLESHGLDAEAAAALRRKDFMTFQQRRADILDHWFVRFFAARCAMGESDRPAIDDILRRVDMQAAQP